MRYGINARIGNITVFSKEGAVNAYKLFCERCHENMSNEASVVLSAATDDMVRLGFTYEDCENLEIEVLQGLN